MIDPLREVAALVERESGVAIRESQLPALEAAIRRVAPRMDAATLLSAAAGPGGGIEIVERLIDEVTVKETYFLRHREELEAIDWAGLAARAMAAGRTSVRVWSAACASGEEAYSLAVLALEAFAPGHAPVDVLATDIAHSALARARQARYGWRSVRHVDEALRQRWFVEDAAGLEVGPAARGLVRFGRHNLLRDPIPPLGEGAFDLVVCRNVLIYFKTDVVRSTIAKVQRAIVPGGTLVLGAADRLSGGTPVAPPKPVAQTAGERRRQRAERRRAPRTEPRPQRSAPAATPPAPLDAEADLHRGMTALADGDAVGAVEALRRALFLDPSNAIAAFQLARAHDARDDRVAARRAYWQALELLEDAGDEVGGVARRDLESAARARLDALSEG